MDLIKLKYMKFQKIIAHTLTGSLLAVVMLMTGLPYLALSAEPGNVPVAPSGLGVPNGASSANVPGGGLRFDNPLGKGNDSLAGLLDKVLKVIIMLGAIVVVFFYIYAGFKFVWARGDAGAIKEATLTLTWTTVGAMVILGAQVISAAISGTVQQLNTGK